MRRGLGAMGALIGLLLLINLILLRMWDPDPVEVVRNQVFDLYQRLAAHSMADAPIVIVDIDESSLARLGQWPWPRTVVADLVSRLQQAGAAAIGFDIVFAEPDRTSPSSVANTLRGVDDDLRSRLIALPDNDHVLAETVGRGRVTMALAGRGTIAGEDPVRPNKKASIARMGTDPKTILTEIPTATRNLPELEEAAAGLGVISLIPEPDGITRRIPLISNIAGILLPTLSIEMLRVATGQRTIAVKANDAGITEIVIAGLAIPTDREGRAWIRFGPDRSIPYVPAADILDGSVAAQAIQGKLAFIGASATGLLDIKTTPRARFMPGVEVHAQFLHNVLTGSTLTRPAIFLAIELGLMAAMSLIILILTPRLSAVSTLLFGIIMTASLFGVSWVLYSRYGMLLDATATAITSFAIYALLTYVKYVREESDKKLVRRSFAQYLSPEVVEQLAEHPEQLKLGGERRDMTIMFCDVRGFTEYSERLDPETLTMVLNRFLTTMSGEILTGRGTIDKYMGDAIMAFWNAPLEDKNHALNACQTALAMMRALPRFNRELAQESEKLGRDLGQFRCGAGINSGPCLVGNMGSDQRFNYSVIGDAVNLASRLEGQCKTYGVPIVIGESTAKAATDLALLELDLIRVKGKHEAVRVYTALGDEAMASDAAYRQLVDANAALLEAYRETDWQQARAWLDRCRTTEKDFGLEAFYTLYAERIAELEIDPPPDGWDGVYEALTK